MSSSIVAGMQVMRTPIQILFLILVTDLPPAVALGMEPGDRNIMQDRPRPKTQPVVLKWMWFSIVINGMILSFCVIIVYMIALSHYLGKLGDYGYNLSAHVFDGEAISDLIRAEETAKNACKLLGGSDDSCTVEHGPARQLMRARTTAFLCVVWSENLRAYSARNFTHPFYEKMFGNTAMQKAIGMALAALAIVVFVPGVSDTVFVLEAAALDWQGWVMDLLGAFCCLAFCEIAKIFNREAVRKARIDLAREAVVEEQKR